MKSQKQIEGKLRSLLGVKEFILNPMQQYKDGTYIPFHQKTTEIAYLTTVIDTLKWVLEEKALLMASLDSQRRVTTTLFAVSIQARQLALEENEELVKLGILNISNTLLELIGVPHDEGKK